MANLRTIIGVALFALLLFVLAPSLLQRVVVARASRRNGCASPIRLAAKDPIFGLDTVADNMRTMAKKRRIKMIYSQFEQYGRTFESWPFGRRVISTVDARNIQFVLSTEHTKFGVGPVRELAQTPMTGKGIITSDGEVWRHGRNMIRPTFTRDHIADGDMFEKHVKRFLDLLPKDEGTVDLQPLLDRLVGRCLTYLVTRC